MLSRLAATGRTAPDGETRAEFVARARLALALVREPLFDPSARALVVVARRTARHLIALLLGHEPRDEATYGFAYCAVARVEAYREAPAYGPFAMVRFLALRVRRAAIRCTARFSAGRLDPPWCHR